MEARDEGQDARRERNAAGMAGLRSREKEAALAKLQQFKLKLQQQQSSQDTAGAKRRGRPAACSAPPDLPTGALPANHHEGHEEVRRAGHFTATQIQSLACVLTTDSLLLLSRLCTCAGPASRGACGDSRAQPARRYPCRGPLAGKPSAAATPPTAAAAASGNGSTWSSGTASCGPWWLAGATRRPAAHAAIAARAGRR